MSKETMPVVATTAPAVISTPTVHEAKLPQEMNTAKGPVESLALMHTYRRPDDSWSEHQFIADWLTPLGVDQDKVGNCSLQIGSSPVIWSSHTDTVHHKPGFQRLRVNAGMLQLTRKARKNSNCLGADDGVGVWLMREMILAKVPGLYIFHRGEEGHGPKGHGTDYITKECPEILKKFKMAIAFDRRGKSSVITHQGWGRTASDAFAKSLGDQLGLGMTPDDTGVYTDTKAYMDLIPECTNISVGYNGAHSSSEEIDIEFVLKLREALINLDVDKLVIERDPSKPEYKSYHYTGPRSYMEEFYGWGDGGDYGGYYAQASNHHKTFVPAKKWDYKNQKWVPNVDEPTTAKPLWKRAANGQWVSDTPAAAGTSKHTIDLTPNKEAGKTVLPFGGKLLPEQSPRGFLDEDAEWVGRASRMRMSDLVVDFPDEIADWLEQQGYCAADLVREIYMRGGVIGK